MARVYLLSTGPDATARRGSHWPRLRLESVREREKPRAETAAMMSGQQLGVRHEPPHGAAHVSLWIKPFDNDPPRRGR